MKFQPKFLTFEQIIALHRMQIDEFGGSHGVGEQYLHTDLYEMAAAYLFHFAGNHAFIDGNKRIAALAAAVFLEVNGLTVTADEDEFENLVMGVAQGRVDKKQIAAFFRKNTS